MKIRGTINAKRYVKYSAAAEFISPFQAACLICGDDKEEGGLAGLCAQCRMGLTLNTGRVCAKCGRMLIAEEEYCETCREHERYFDLARSCYVYEGAARDIVTAYKYSSRVYYARHMAQDMAELYNAADMSCSVMVPVPTSKEKIAERGFDHIAVLCLFLSKLLHMPLAENAITKVKDNSAQAALSGIDRELNVQGVYARGEDISKIKGAHVLLVDDVLTTGATASAAAKVLKRFKASKVSVLTFASTRYKVTTENLGGKL